jgi:hypothetical protein
MLFLSQVLGEEEDTDRRAQLVDVLSRAVIFPRSFCLATRFSPPMPRT